METLLILMVGLASCVWLSTWQASVLIVLVLLIRWGAGRLMPAPARYLLWCLVLVRLSVPTLPQSSWSVFNLAPPSHGSEQVGETVADARSIDPDGGTAAGHAGERSTGLVADVFVRPLLPARSGGIESVAPSKAVPGETGRFVAGREQEDWSAQSVIVLIWWAGALWLAVRLVVAWRMTVTRLRTARVVDEPRFVHLLEECRRLAGVRRPVALVALESDLTPAVTGILRPKILVPEQVLESFTTAELRFVLLHELIHVRRGDVAVNLAASVVRVLHWFNPLVWLALRSMRADREVACDAAVLDCMGESQAGNYGRTTIKLLGLVNSLQPPEPVAVGILDYKPLLLRRIAMIGQFRRSSTKQRVFAGVLLLLLACVGLTDAMPGEPASATSQESLDGAGQTASDLAHKPSREASRFESDVNQAPADAVQFLDITLESGLVDDETVSSVPGTDRMGNGCAFIDFDGDGDQDIVLLRATITPGAASVEGDVRLYENNGVGAFRDVTPGSNAWHDIAGIGIAVGDFDGDGRPDLYISAIGRNRLLRNAGDGRFEDVTERAGVGGDPGIWHTGCGWIDIDNDGDLDLFMNAWGRIDTSAQGAAPAAPSLFRNNGDGRFTDITSEAGLQADTARSLGLTFADVDDDGWLDILVANDGAPNCLYRNTGSGRFEDVGLQAGIAVGPDGTIGSSTGIDVGLLGNGELSIAIGNGLAESVGLKVGPWPIFQDLAVASGLARQTMDDSTFGVGLVDFDLDGQLDLFVANGLVDDTRNGAALPDLFLGVTGRENPQHLSLPGPKHVGRGAAFADIDGDGDQDILISSLDRSPRLLRNETRSGNHWLRLKLIGSRSNRDAIGSRITVETSGGQRQQRQVMPTRGYLSQSELIVTFGLGDAPRVQRLIVDWADGSRSRIEDVAADQTLLIRQEAVKRGPEPLANVDATQEGQAENIATPAEGADESGRVTRSADSETARVQLHADEEGALSGVRFGVDELGAGEAGLEELGRRMRVWAADPKRLRVAEREVEIRADHSLRYDVITRTITICTGQADPETGKLERYVGRVRFAPPARDLQVTVAFLRARSGERLSSKAVVMWDDDVVRVEDVAKRLSEWLKRESVAAADITLRLRADHEVNAGLIQDLIEDAQKVGIQRLAISTLKTKDDAEPASENTVLRLRAIEAESAATFIQKVFGDTDDPIVVPEKSSNSLIISTRRRQTLQMIRRILEELGEPPAEKPAAKTEG